MHFNSEANFLQRIFYQLQMIYFIGYNIFWPFLILQLKLKMISPKCKCQNNFQVQEHDEIGLLPEQITQKSTHATNQPQKERTPEMVMNKQEGNNPNNKRAILYCIGIGILSIIIIFDLTWNIGLYINRRSDFVNNLQQIKIESTTDKENIMKLSLANTKNDQTNGRARRKQVIPSFQKVSDIILLQHVEQTISEQNHQKIQQLKNINPNGYLPDASQTQINRDYTNENVKLTMNTISLPQLPLSQVPMHNPTNTPSQQNLINNFVQPPPTSDTNTFFSTIIPNIQSLSHPINKDIGNVTTSFPDRKRKIKRIKRVTVKAVVQTAEITQSQIKNAKIWKQLVNEDYKINSQLAQLQRKYYNDKHNILDYNQLPFCIVVPTFNNADDDRYLKNIRSIVMQEYTNYHIIVIDDASTDNTGILISNFLQQQNKIPNDRYQVIVNSQRKMAISNLRLAATKFCKPEEIFMIVDGDDELLGRQVLHVFNAAFQKNQAWYVYSNFLGSTGGIGYSRSFPNQIIEDNDYRKYHFVTSHLRAYFTKLFLNIKEDDLRDDNGEYYHAANDVAISIPILEQAHKRVFYLPELTYFYNSNTGLNNHMVRLSEQKENDRKIRTKPRYTELTSFSISR